MPDETPTPRSSKRARKKTTQKKGATKKRAAKKTAQEPPPTPRAYDVSAAQPGREEAEALIAAAKDADTLAGWVGVHADPAARDEMRARFQDTKDIAGAADALCAEGSIVYDQATAEQISQMVAAAGLPTATGSARRDEDDFDFQAAIRDSFIGGTAENWLYATRGNCYEFVHFAADIAGSTGGRRHSGDRLKNVIDPSTLEEWDFKTPIPRGKVIVGCVPPGSIFGGQGEQRTYHFAVSLGDGWVANNRDEGVRKEPLKDVFGGWFTYYWLPGGRIVFGDYACYAPKPAGALADPATEGTPALVDPAGETTYAYQNPRSANEMRPHVAGAGALAAGVVALGVWGAVAFGGTGADAPPPVGATDVPTAAAPTDQGPGPTDAPTGPGDTPPATDAPAGTSGWVYEGVAEVRQIHPQPGGGSRIQRTTGRHFRIADNTSPQPVDRFFVTTGSSASHDELYGGTLRQSTVLFGVYGGAGTIPLIGNGDEAAAEAIRDVFLANLTERADGGPALDWAAVFEGLGADPGEVCGGRVTLDIDPDQGGPMPGFTADGELAGSGTWVKEAGGDSCRDFPIRLEATLSGP